MDSNTTGLFLIALTFLILFFGTRSGSQELKFISSFAWLIPVAWLVLSPPSSIASGTPLQIICIVVCIGIMIIQMVWAFKKNLQVTNTNKDKYGNVISKTEDRDNGWHLPNFMSSGQSDEEIVAEARATRREKLEDRRKRFRDALKGEERDD